MISLLDMSLREKYTTVEAIGCAKDKQQACITIRNRGANTLASAARFQASILKDKVVSTMQTKSAENKKGSNPQQQLLRDKSAVLSCIGAS